MHSTKTFLILGGLLCCLIAGLYVARPVIASSITQPSGGCVPAGSLTDLLTDNGMGGCNSNVNATLSTGGILTKYDGLTTAGLGVEPIVALSALANSSATSLVTLATAPAAGAYELHYTIDLHTPCTTGTAQLGVTFSWTANSARTEVLGDASLPSTQTPTAGWLSGTLPIYVVSGNVTYTPSLDQACATGTPSWDGAIWLTRAN